MTGRGDVMTQDDMPGYRAVAEQLGSAASTRGRVVEAVKEGSSCGEEEQTAWELKTILETRRQQLEAQVTCNLRLLYFVNTFVLVYISTLTHPRILSHTHHAYLCCF